MRNIKVVLNGTGNQAFYTLLGLLKRFNQDEILIIDINEDFIESLQKRIKLEGVPHEFNYSTHDNLPQINNLLFFIDSSNVYGRDACLNLIDKLKPQNIIFEKPIAHSNASLAMYKKFLGLNNFFINIPRRFWSSYKYIKENTKADSISKIELSSSMLGLMENYCHYFDLVALLTNQNITNVNLIKQSDYVSKRGFKEFYGEIGIELANETIANIICHEDTQKEVILKIFSGEDCSKPKIIFNESTGKLDAENHPKISFNQSENYTSNIFDSVIRNSHMLPRLADVYAYSDKFIKEACK